MRILATICLLWLSLLSIVSASPAQQAIPRALHISGNHIVDGNNMIIPLQGATLSLLEYSCSPRDHYTALDFATMRDSWRMNTVKIPVNPIFWVTGCPTGQGSSAQYHATIRQAVKRAEQQGLYVMLVLLQYDRAKHGGDAAPDARTVATATDLARQYASDGRVLLETFSEPHGLTDAAWLAGVQPQIDAINRVAAHTIILVDGDNWSGVPGLAYAKGYRPTGHNLAYAAHIYDAGHNADPSLWSSTFGSLAAIYPVVATEFGDTVRCNGSWLAELMPFMRAHLAGWLAWTWDNSRDDCHRPAIISGWDGTPSTYGAPIHAFYTSTSSTPLAKGATIYPDVTINGHAYRGSAWQHAEFQATLKQDVAQAVALHLTILRPTDFLDGASSPTNPQVWANMDYLMQISQANGIHIILDLSAYRNWRKAQALPIYAAAAWSPFITFVVGRYHGNSTIAYYAIAGEIPAVTWASSPTANQYIAFFGGVAQAIHSIDPAALVSTGGLSYLNWNSGIPWQTLEELPDINIVAIHVYSRGDETVTIPRVSAWAAAHHKPWLIEEFGFQQRLGDSTRAADYARVYAEAKIHGASGAICWNLGPEVSVRSYDVNTQTPLTWSAIRQASQ